MARVGRGIRSALSPIITKAKPISRWAKAACNHISRRRQIFLCPSDDLGEENGLSYASNACANFSATTPAAPSGTLHRGRKLSYFQSTSLWALLVEESESSPDTSGETTTDDGYYLLSSSNGMSTRHAEGSNVAFVDGHVKWFKPENFLQQGLAFGGAKPAKLGDTCPGT